MVFALGIIAAAPLEAQTTATLTVTARVVDECTVGVKSKRELAKLARQLNDPSILRRCSKGVVSRVNQKVTRLANVAPVVRQPAALSKKTARRHAKSGKADIVLVTVTY
jgi:hypothetical protein